MLKQVGKAAAENKCRKENGTLTISFMQTILVVVNQGKGK
jgi:hypothetical protein